MSEQNDRYIAGVPCWVDLSTPDPDAAVAFYSGLFGWECEDVMPEGAPVKYFMARLRGEDVAAIGSPPPGAPPAPPAWATYIWVEDADATAGAVREAGGQVLVEPMSVFDSGTMAVFADTEGAAISVWQPQAHRGATIVNEHGSVNFNSLGSRDPEKAKAFYGAVFGWDTMSLGDGMTWTLPAYGDFLEERTPGMRKNMAGMGAPTGFENVVAALNPIPDNEPDVPPHWSVTFGVNDADEAAAKATELGGTIVAQPFDAPWVRMTVITDPQGATFVASQFKLENKDLVGSSWEAAGA